MRMKNLGKTLMEIGLSVASEGVRIQGGRGLMAAGGVVGAPLGIAFGLMKGSSEMKRNGKAKSNGKKVTREGRKQQPVEYRLQLAFKLRGVHPEDGISVGSDVEVPIRKGFGSSLDKIKKGDVVQLLRQIAEAIEKDDYSSFGLPVDMTSLKGAVSKARTQNKPN